MKVELEVNPDLNETTVVIKTKEVSIEINEVIKTLQNIGKNNNVVVSKDGKVYIFNFDELESVYSNQGKVYVRKDNEEYITKSRLYELEEQLSNKNYIRISNSEIINFDKVENLDLSVTGTIEINLKSGYTTYVSRRNMKKIKQYLNI